MKIRGKTVILDCVDKLTAVDIDHKINVMKKMLLTDTPEEALLIFLNLTIQSVNGIVTKAPSQEEDAPQSIDALDEEAK